MNERIQELVKKANGVTYDDDGNELTLALVGKELEIFAELFVRECIAVHEDDYGVDIIGNVLKKHFGVKE